MANKDAFEGKKLGGLTGLDQRLFEERGIDTTKQRNNDTTPLRTDERSSQRNNGQSSQRVSETSEEAAIIGSEERASRSAPEIRLPERHSHDIYRDQVRWMNRVKLELEEAHGKRITSNGLVQLALDLLRLDYEAAGDSSRLVQVLIRGTSPEKADSL